MKKIIILILSLFGCSWGYQEHQRAGFREFDRAFESMEYDSEIGEDYELTLKIQVVGDNIKFRIESLIPGMVGYSSSDCQHIGVLGRRMKDGSIYINQAALGHELCHVLHYLDPQIMDPDK